MKIIKKFRLWIITSLSCMLPSIYGVIVWDKLPDKVPTHWNMEGVVDGYSSKAFAVFGLPLIIVALNTIVNIALGTDPKKENHADKLKFLGLWIAPITSIFTCTACILTGLGKEYDMLTIVSLFCAVLFLVIGNYMPKCKQNYTIGIKLPWTLNSEENWNKTHRFAGFLWSVLSIILIILILLGYQIMILPIAIIMVAVPSIYSFILFKKNV